MRHLMPSCSAANIAAFRFGSAPEQAARPTGKQTLDVNDFLKLMTVQLTSQDPMKPMEDTQFISQMASFTSLQQMRDLSANFKTFTAGQSINSAQNYLGKIVGVTSGDGSVTGEVTGITIRDGAPQLIIGGVAYDPADVFSVLPKPVSIAPTAP